MRWLQMTLVALAMALILSGPAEARSTTVRRTTSFDPVTGERITQVTKIRSDRGRNHWRHGRPRARAFGAVGAPIIAQRGFPRFARNGERIWRAGRLWEFNRPLSRWIIVR